MTFLKNDGFERHQIKKRDYFSKFLWKTILYFSSLKKIGHSMYCFFYYFLSHIFRSSIETKTFPELWNMLLYVRCRKSWTELLWIIDRSLSSLFCPKNVRDWFLLPWNHFFYNIKEKTNMHFDQMALLLVLQSISTILFWLVPTVIKV